MGNNQEQRKVRFGHTEVMFPSENLGALENCNHLLDDQDELHTEMALKGYLFIRGLHDREEVLSAKLAVLNYIASCGDILNMEYPLNEGALRESCGVGCVPFMEGHNEISHKNAVLSVLEGSRPFRFFKHYFGSDAATFDYKWLRAMPQEGFTGAHVDNVYMSRGSPDVLTMWTPFDDVPIKKGVLAICEGSHRLPSFDKFQATYGSMDAEMVGLKGTGWFTEDPFEITRKFGGQWKTSDFQAGDVLIFNLRTVHMSTTNTTHFARISCDTRWQPASHTMDPRFCHNPSQTSTANFGLHHKLEKSGDTKSTTIDRLKEEWGI